MKTKILLPVLVFIVLLGSSFTNYKSKGKVTPDLKVETPQLSNSVDYGYFVLNGQEYHIFADEETLLITEMWRTDNAMHDVALIEYFGGYVWWDSTHPLSANVSFNDGGNKWYNGPVYF